VGWETAPPFVEEVMPKRILYSNCDVCGGDGVVTRLIIDPDTHSETWLEETCSKCSGDGTRKSGKLDKDLTDLLDDILDKVNDIKEKVDAL
jgi:hypothetical protein